jgi:hypothetical protein
MCDYSLHLVASRAAKVGDELVTTKFVYEHGMRPFTRRRCYHVTRPRLGCALMTWP